MRIGSSRALPALPEVGDASFHPNWKQTVAKLRYRLKNKVSSGVSAQLFMVMPLPFISGIKLGSLGRRLRCLFSKVLTFVCCIILVPTEDIRIMVTWRSDSTLPSKLRRKNQLNINKASIKSEQNSEVLAEFHLSTLLSKTDNWKISLWFAVKLVWSFNSLMDGF